MNEQFGEARNAIQSQHDVPLETTQEIVPLVQDSRPKRKKWLKIGISASVLLIIIGGVLLWRYVGRIKDFSCSGSPEPAAVGETVSLKASFKNGIAPYIFVWEGDEELKGNADNVNKVYSTKGNKKVEVCVTDKFRREDCTSCEIKVKDSTLVFLSSASFGGGFEKIKEADNQCSQLAAKAGLPDYSNYKAWISDGYTFVKDRFFHSPLPYKLINGEIIANNWEDLTDGTIDLAINLDEFGNYHAQEMAWTGTDPAGNGRPYTDFNCANWTTHRCPSGDSTYSGKVGINYSNGEQWTAREGSLGCCALARLYCFEQLR